MSGAHPASGSDATGGDRPPRDELARCPLCGARFPAAAACAEGCPMAAHCRTLCCPHCHYRFVQTSVVAGWLERLLKGVRA